MAAPAPKAHRWQFYRAGGVDQARIDTGADILALESLDQKLWVALSCPVKGLEFDERTLALLDTDKDGRVRAPEILAAVKWVGSVLRDPEELVRGNDALPLAAINDATDEGKRILAAAKRLLAGLGKPDAKAISVADTAKTAEVIKTARLNGDGCVPPESIDDAEAKKVATEIISCLGSVPDRGGLPAIDQAKVDEFFAECQAYDLWYRKADGNGDGGSILPLGDKTGDAYSAWKAIKPKVEDYIARTHIAEYDPRALAAVNREESAYLAIAAKDMSVTAQEVATFPLAKVEPGKPLSLATGVNPAWAGVATEFREKVVAPLLGKQKSAITEVEWKTIGGRFAQYESWIAGKTGAKVEKLGVARVREILAGKTKEALAKLIAEDKAIEPEVSAIEGVERLVRYNRDLHQLLNNYVSFTDFYTQRRKAIFQIGTLYLDGRSCDLCFKVEDAGKHAALAAMAKTYLAYCDCTRAGSGEKMTIAAAFTAGDADFLFVGRNGLFYDRKGRDWDATITKLVENPISIGQSFWSPYKRVLRFIDDQIAKRAAAADAASGDKLTGAAVATGDAAASGKAPAAAPKKMDVGTVAAIGVAVGGITAALGALLQAFFGLGMWMPLGILAIVLLISGPAMLIAVLKLRQRNLGPILDANGWAVNARVLVNIPLGGAMTSIATLPAGATRALHDPYAPKKSIWPKLILILAILGLAGFGLYEAGILQEWIAAIRGTGGK